jgi:DNA-binding NarL/FixJ family response regulator
MPTCCSGRKGDFAIMLRVVRKSQAGLPSEVVIDRHLVAEFCRLLAPCARRNEIYIREAESRNERRLSPRMRQTLQRLLAGDQEKEVANRLGVSQNTVHVYVKALYRRYQVSSRGELLSKFVVPMEH